MFDSGPNYSSYTLEQLFEAYASINKELYPERVQIIKDEIARKQHGEYKCFKCSCGAYEASYLYGSQDRLESIFDIESAIFVTISCLDCGYTELYKQKSSTIGSLLDFFIS